MDPERQRAGMEKQLIAIDRLIRKCEDERAEMATARKPVPEIETVCEFLHAQRRRRECILHELKKAGGSEAGAYHRKEEIEFELDNEVVKSVL